MDYCALGIATIFDQFYIPKFSKFTKFYVYVVGITFLFVKVHWLNRGLY